jgi:hypothetical protein
MRDTEFSARSSDDFYNTLTALEGPPMLETIRHSIDPLAVRTYGYTHYIRESHVYGKVTPPIPAGHVDDGFRPPLNGDLYLGLHGKVSRANQSFIESAPYIILKPKPERPLMRTYKVTLIKTFTERDIYGDMTIRIPEGKVDVGFRTARAGEIFINQCGIVVMARSETDHPHIILEDAPKPDRYTIEVPHGSGAPIVFVKDDGPIRERDQVYRFETCEVEVSLYPQLPKTKFTKLRRIEPQLEAKP